MPKVGSDVRRCAKCGNASPQITSARLLVLVTGIGAILLGAPTAALGELAGAGFVAAGIVIVLSGFSMMLRARAVFEELAKPHEEPSPVLSNCFVLGGYGLSLNKGTRCQIAVNTNSLTLVSELAELNDIEIPYRNVLGYEVGGLELVTSNRVSRSFPSAASARSNAGETVLRVTTAHAEVTLLSTGITPDDLHRHLKPLAHGFGVAETARTISPMAKQQPRRFDVENARFIDRSGETSDSAATSKSS